MQLGLGIALVWIEEFAGRSVDGRAPCHGDLTTGWDEGNVVDRDEGVGGMAVADVREETA